MTTCGHSKVIIFIARVLTLILINMDSTMGMIVELGQIVTNDKYDSFSILFMKWSLMVQFVFLVSKMSVVIDVTDNDCVRIVN